MTRNKVINALEEICLTGDCTGRFDALSEAGDMLYSDDKLLKLYRRALDIAVLIMFNAGLCRLEDYGDCRRGRSDSIMCRRCIKKWIISKAKENGGEV